MNHAPSPAPDRTCGDSAPRGRFGASPLAGWLFVFPGLVLAWAVSAWAFERDRRAELAAHQDTLVAELVRLQDHGDVLLRDLEDVRNRLGLRIEQLEAQLFRAQQESRGLRETLGLLAAQRDAREDPPDALEDFDPEEQRRHVERLQHFNESFRAQGLGRFRFLDFELGEGRVLHRADLLETDLDGIVRGSYLAGELVLELDRATGVLTLRLRDAVQIWRGKRHSLGEEHVVELTPQDPRGLEIALGGYLRTKNDWPAAAAPEDADAVLRRLEWKSRFDRLLRHARDEGRYELFELGGVEGYEFRTVTLLGYTDKGRLERRIRAERLRVHVDAASDRVELRFHTGFVEGREGRFEFPDRWYRLPLPGTDAEEARRILTGAVFAFDAEDR